MKYKSLEAACRAIAESLGDVMEHEVLDTVKEAEGLAIHEYVYGAGHPKRYKRRYESGGLSDPNNMQGNVSRSGKGARLSVVNTTRASGSVFSRRTAGGAPLTEYEQMANDAITTDKNLPAVVEYGIVDGYDMGEGWWSAPRPFTLATEGYLESTKKHVDAIQRGLTRHGFKVRKK